MIISVTKSKNRFQADEQLAHKSTIIIFFIKKSWVPAFVVVYFNRNLITYPAYVKLHQHYNFWHTKQNKKKIQPKIETLWQMQLSKNVDARTLQHLGEITVFFLCSSCERTKNYKCLHWNCYESNMWHQFTRSIRSKFKLKLRNKISESKKFFSSSSHSRKMCHRNILSV